MSANLLLPRRLVYFTAYTVVLLSLCRANSVKADVIVDALTTSVVIQTTISDADIFLLTQFAGLQMGQTLSYQSISDANGWSSPPPLGTPTLFGMYKGENLSVSYDGLLSALPTGAVTWTSTGSYGSDLWNSSGSATITDTSSISFAIKFLDTLTVGNNTGSFDVIIPGTLDTSLNPSEIDFLDSSETGMMVANKKPIHFPPLALTFKYRRPVLTDFDIGGVPIIQDMHGCTPRPLSDKGCGPGFSPPISAVTLVGDISTVPEPLTLLLVGSGVVGLFRFAWRQAKGRCN